MSCAAFPEIAVDQFPDGMGRKGPPVPLTFVSGFLVQDPISDLDGSGVFDLGDITLFVTSFVAPCP